MFLVRWFDACIDALAKLAPDQTFLNFAPNLRGLLAVVLVCLICGAVGSLVMGNRMAFLSDALAHCAFAGVALGLLLGLVAGATKDSAFYSVGLLIVMVGFGIVFGLAIAFVREHTALASDTVIGVFFAGAIGFGAMLLQALAKRAYINPENFLFGDPVNVSSRDLLILIALAVVTAGVLAFKYNEFVFTSFNASLARSRRVPIRFCNYLLVVLLALIINLCLKTVGALLINALLIVPAATASNLSRNLREMFWWSTGLCLAVGVAGPWASWELGIPDPTTGEILHFGWSGLIVVFSVILFFASMVVGPLLRGKQGL
jgi:zinc transport system permease protein